VRTAGSLISIFLTTGACTAWAFADPVPAVDPEPAVAPEDAAPAPADVVVETSPGVAITAWQRLSWFDKKTFGISNLGGSINGAAWLTLLDRPHEAGPHWEGFAERYGVAVSTNAVSNAMEAGERRPKRSGIN